MSDTYMIRKGDTLSKIAKQYKTTVNELTNLNSIKDPNKIRAGAALKMPGFITQTAQGAAADSGASSDDTSSGTDASGWEDLIEQIYEKSRESQLADLEGQYGTQTADYERQKENAHKTYDPLRNEAYVNSEMAERSRKESMANMGLSGAGGTSQTLQQRNTNTLLSALGNISRQQQDFTGNVNFALGQLNAQYGASNSSINSQIDSDKLRAYLDQGNWEDSFALQQGQFDIAKSDSEFNRYFDLYTKKLITRKQLKEKFPEYFK